MQTQDATKPQSRPAFNVQCSMEWSREAAEKVKDTIEKAFYAGLLGDNWTVKVQRQNGGKLRVWIDTENKT